MTMSLNSLLFQHEMNSDCIRNFSSGHCYLLVKPWIRTGEELGCPFCHEAHWLAHSLTPNTQLLQK